MSTTDTVTIWLGLLKAGNPVGAQQLWERYFRRLVEGYTAAEIAGRLRCSQRTVERKLQMIRDLWAEEVLRE
jgi:DNA-directed RNA polymerase specialized sigma24 family protein